VSRNQQLVRQWLLLKTLGHYGKTIKELARELDVTERTIRRDLHAVEDAGFPVYDELIEGDARAEPGEKRWRLIPEYDRLPPIPLSRDEAFAVLAAARALGHLEDTPIGEAFGTLVEKLRRAITPLERELSELSGTYLDDAEIERSYAAERETIEVLLAAINKRRLLDVTYHAAHTDAVTERTIAPYCFWRSGGELYVIAHCYLRGEARSFRVDRFRRVAVSAEEREWPADFDPVDFIRYSFGPWVGEPKEVVLRFTGVSADYVEGLKVHQTQQQRRRDDGSLELGLRVAPSINLAQWLAGFGGDVLVEKPRELRRWVAELHAGGLEVNGFDG
jgi:predicted DNA-binding transcriptional regulator YafY